MAIKWTRPAAGFCLTYVKDNDRYILTQDVHTYEYYIAKRPNVRYEKKVYKTLKELYIALFAQELAGEDQTEETYKHWISFRTRPVFGMDNYRIHTDEFNHKYAVDLMARSVKRFDEWKRISPHFEYEADVKEWADKFL